MTQTDITQKPGITSERYLLLSHLLAGCVGMILLAAGLMKATDVTLFIRQLKGYGILSHPFLLTMSAWGLIALQTALGVGLILFHKPRTLLPLTTGFWLILVGGTLYAWLTGVTDDCGCYGAWMKHSPKFATMENLVLLAATFSAWQTSPRQVTSKKRAKAWAFAVAVVAGIVLPLTFGFNPLSISQIRGESAGVELGHVEVQGVDAVDLNRGLHLIVLMGTDCTHCREFLPRLDDLAEEKGIPSLIALCPDDEMKCSRFVDAFDPLFPIGRIREKDFWRLVGQADIPKFLLLRDGRVQKAWVNKLPGPEEIRAALPQPSMKKGKA